MTKPPHILVKTLQNEPVDLLKKYSGDNVLILFYNNDCLGCTGRAIPLAYEISKEFKNLNVVGVHSNFRSTVTEEDILSIFTSKELPFPIFIDEEHTMYDVFQCEGTPHWIIVNKNGEIVRSVFGSQENARTRLGYALDELQDAQ